MLANIKDKQKNRKKRKKYTESKEINLSHLLALFVWEYNKILTFESLTLFLPIATIVPYANSLDPD